jgi:hypothetical protein
MLLNAELGLFRESTMEPFIVCLLSILALVLGAYTPQSTEATDFEAAKSLQNLLDVLETGSLKEHLLSRDVDQSCSASQTAMRRE